MNVVLRILEGGTDKIRLELNVAGVISGSAGDWWHWGIQSDVGILAVFDVDRDVAYTTNTI